MISYIFRAWLKWLLNYWITYVHPLIFSEGFTWMKLSFIALQGAVKKITLSKQKFLSCCPLACYVEGSAYESTPFQLKTVDISWKKRKESQVSAPESLRWLYFQVRTYHPLWSCHSPSEIRNEEWFGSLGATWPDDRREQW